MHTTTSVIWETTFLHDPHVYMYVFVFVLNKNFTNQFFSSKNKF